MAKNIEAFRLKTTIEVDASKGRRELQASEKDVGKLGASFTKLSKDINSSMKGAEVGKRFGSDFSASATSVITGSIKSLGQTLGSLIGTVILPGIGTAIGSTIGSAVDTAVEKISGPVLEKIRQGIDLNKKLEEVRVEFTTFTGSEKEAVAYLERLKKLSNDTGLRMPFLVDASERVYDFTQDLKLTNTIIRASIEQSADFGGSVESFTKISDALGIIAEKGDLSGTSLKKLYGLGIRLPERLAEATGQSLATIKKWIAKGEIDGAVAARLVSESIIREKAGFAQKLTVTTTAGAERRSEALQENLATLGTQKVTKGMGDYYRAQNELISGPGGEKLAQFIDDAGGKLVNMIEKAVSVGVDVGKGLASGILSSDALGSVKSAMSTLGGAAIDELKSVFEIKSPSELMAREIGVPIGQGIAAGIVPGFLAVLRDETLPQLQQIIERLIVENAKRWNVPAELIRAVIGQESKGRPGSVSPKGARGLMQLMPATARRFGVADIHDPAQNISGGTQYLRFLIDRFEGKLDLVLAGYNAGEGAVEKYGNKVPPYAETQEYVRRITASLQRGGGAAMSSIQSGPAKGGVWSDWAEFQRVTKLFTAIERKDLEERADAIKRTAEKLNAVRAQLPVAEATLEQSRPRAGYVDLNAQYKAGFAVDRLRDERDRLAASLSRLTTEQQQAIQATVSLHLAEEERTADLKRASAPKLAEAIPAAKRMDEVLKGIANDTLPTMSVRLGTFEENMRAASGPLADFGGGLPPLTKEMLDFGKVARAELALTTDMMSIATEELHRSVGIRNELMGALTQAAGYLPQQQVGKKRGFFSKLLGFAAPFLSFIPGVGPILSTIAGIGSQAAAGNWAGVATGIAGGFSGGGAFTRGPSTSSPARPPSGGNPFSGPSVTGRRAFGGPVSRGRSYLVGEHRPELFSPDSDGWIHPRVGGQRGGGDPLTVHLPRLLAVLERQEAALTRLEGVPAGHIVRQGIRAAPDAVGHGLTRAMDSDAGLIRKMGQRMRLS